MELILPETWPISVQMLVAALGAFAALIWAGARAYRGIMSELHIMRTDIDGMKARNIAADMENIEIKREQADQKTTVAVMAEQMRNQGVVIGEIKDGVTELLKAHRERGR